MFLGTGYWVLGIEAESSPVPSARATPVKQEQGRFTGQAGQARLKAERGEKLSVIG